MALTWKDMVGYALSAEESRRMSDLDFTPLSDADKKRLTRGALSDSLNAILSGGGEVSGNYSDVVKEMSDAGYKIAPQGKDDPLVKQAYLNGTWTNMIKASGQDPNSLLSTGSYTANLPDTEAYKLGDATDYDVGWVGKPINPSADKGFGNFLGTPAGMLMMALATYGVGSAMSPAASGAASATSGAAGATTGLAAGETAGMTAAEIAAMNAGVGIPAGLEGLSSSLGSGLTGAATAGLMGSAVPDATLLDLIGAEGMGELGIDLKALAANTGKNILTNLGKNTLKSLTTPKVTVPAASAASAASAQINTPTAQRTFYGQYSSPQVQQYTPVSSAATLPSGLMNQVFFKTPIPKLESYTKSTDVAEEIKKLLSGYARDYALYGMGG